MKKLLLLFGFLCLGMVSVHAYGINGSVKEVPQHFIVSGVVVDAYTNKPIANAYIQIWGAGDTVEAVIADLYTDENGRYSVELGYWDDYSIYCSAQGYISDDSIFEFDENGVVKNFKLKKEGANQGLRTIRGIVKNEAEEPMSGTKITVVLSHWFNRGDAPSAVTNEKGEYVIELPEDYKGGVLYAMIIEDDERGMFIQERFEPLDNTIKWQGLFQICEESLYEVNVIDAKTKEPISNAKLTVTREKAVYDGDEDPYKTEECLTDDQGFWYDHTYIGFGTDKLVSIMCEAEGYESKSLTVQESVGNNGNNYVYGPNYLIFELKKEGCCSDDAGLVDGINTVNATGKALKHYSVSGIEIAPNAKGLHIVNGKKVLVK